MHQLDQSILYDFQLAGTSQKLWKRVGESYEHVLMKALGYAMLAREYPDLRIEHKVGLRYKPDLVSQAEDGRFLFWGECGQVSVRKIAWLLKHARVERLVIFKINTRTAAALAEELRAEIPAKYRAPGRVTLIAFVPDIITLTLVRRIPRVPPEWYTTIHV